MKCKVLKLNASYIPIDVVSWEEAITDWCNGRVEIVEAYTDMVLRHGYDEATKTHKGEIPHPAVIRVIGFNTPKGNKKYYKPFTRRNVWERDDRKCQYCGHHISLSNMEYEHVHPQSKGGTTTWNNIVSACTECNRRKADKTCSEAHMYPIKAPIAPLIADGYIGGMLDRVHYKIGNLDKLDNHVWNNYIKMIRRSI